MKLNGILEKQILKLNEENYSSLKKKVESGEVTWVLGAGISVPAGLPQWDELLAKMWARLTEIESEMAEDEVYAIFEIARNDKLSGITDYSSFRKKVDDAYKGEYKHIFSGINVLESAEYLWNYIDSLVPNEVAMQERILKALIRGALSIGMNEVKLRENLVNQAVGILAKLLAKCQNGNVITYNYDNILEFCLQEIGGVTDKDVKVVCDCDQDKSEQAGKINIHHPHGALRIVDGNFGKESKRIILTESSYYDMERKAYNWENSVQAKALMETSCIFMGFSGEDYNFRRIIKNIDFHFREETPKHYMFFCIDNLVENIFGKGLDEDERKALVRSEGFIYENIQMINRLYAQYHYWEKHGILPVWSTFEELPKMIQHLAE